MKKHQLASFTVNAIVTQTLRVYPATTAQLVGSNCSDTEADGRSVVSDPCAARVRCIFPIALQTCGDCSSHIRQSARDSTQWRYTAAILQTELVDCVFATFLNCIFLFVGKHVLVCAMGRICSYSFVFFSESREWAYNWLQQRGAVRQQERATCVTQWQSQSTVWIQYHG